jgi:uncharacterized protein (TIGR03083 family)
VVPGTVRTVLLTPRYDGAPVLHIQGPAGDPSVPLLRQLRRLAEVLATLEPEQWTSGTRCARWSVQDVVIHLVGVSELWESSIVGARSGAPTRLFRSFDPVTTPPGLVDAVRGWTPSETLSRFVATTDAIAATLAGLDDEEWSLTGESPLGHVGLHLVAVHALWDSWLHERDVLLPLGIAPSEQADEVITCLWYAAAIGPALLAAGGSTRRRTLAVDTTDSDVRVVVEAGPNVMVRLGTRTVGRGDLAGRAVDLAEGLSFRAPLVPDVAPIDRRLLGGLDLAFDLV